MDGHGGAGERRMNSGRPDVDVSADLRRRPHGQRAYGSVRAAWISLDQPGSAQVTLDGTDSTGAMVHDHELTGRLVLHGHTDRVVDSGQDRTMGAQHGVLAGVDQVVGFG